jgi:hypothetical protein
MSRLWDTEPELIPFATTEELGIIKNGLFVVHEPMVRDLRQRLERWRAWLPNPTREQMLQVTHEENRMHARLEGGNQQFWDGLEEDWRRKQKPDFEPVRFGDNWSPEGREWLEAERREGHIYKTFEDANSTYLRFKQSQSPKRQRYEVPPESLHWMQRNQDQSEREQLKQKLQDLSHAEVTKQKDKVPLKARSEDDLQREKTQKGLEAPESHVPKSPALQPSSERANAVRRVFQRIRAVDKATHSFLMGRYPRTIRFVDGFLGWLFGIFKHAIFGVIVGLLLVALAVTGRVTVIVAISLGAAWLLTVVWVAKSKFVRKLTILSRLITVIGIAVFFAVIGIVSGRWTLAQYKQTKVEERSNLTSPTPIVDRPGPIFAPSPSPLNSPTPSSEVIPSQSTNTTRHKIESERERRKREALRILHSQKGRQF